MENRGNLPTIAAAILSITGVAALIIGVVLAGFPVLSGLGYDVPQIYRAILSGLALLGGSIHIVAGRWCRQRQHFFRTVVAILVGMILLQITFLLDIIALVLIGLGRHEFQSFEPQGSE